MPELILDPISFKIVKESNVEESNVEESNVEESNVEESSVEESNVDVSRSGDWSDSEVELLMMCSVLQESVATVVKVSWVFSFAAEMFS